MLQPDPRYLLYFGHSDLDGVGHTAVPRLVAFPGSLETYQQGRTQTGDRHFNVHGSWTNLGPVSIPGTNGGLVRSRWSFSCLRRSRPPRSRIASCSHRLFAGTG